ncbi:unnamed protein product [Menidia menidia]|uniref:(Atlantic silverside) hypothetical protein n=1 Tax=Menidia menidia TaxID=238744 RepID=A0A8S4AUJ4_9TELE|nr:unnamed protein product [Menidia menidia]
MPCDVAPGNRKCCLCFGSKGEVARRKEGGDVTGLLKLFSWLPCHLILVSPVGFVNSRKVSTSAGSQQRSR